MTEKGILTGRLSGGYRFKAVSPEDIPVIGDWVGVLPTSMDSFDVKALVK